MTPTERKVLLLRAGIKQAEIARELGVTQSTVYKIIHDLKASRRVREAIARAVDKPVKELWPQEARRAA